MFSLKNKNKRQKKKERKKKKRNLLMDGVTALNRERESMASFPAGMSVLLVSCSTEQVFRTNDVYGKAK